MNAKEIIEILIQADIIAAESDIETTNTQKREWIAKEILAKSKEEAVDITNKVETLIGYLELWYRRYSPPSGFFAVIEEAKEWLAAFGKEGEDETIISNIS